MRWGKNINSNFGKRRDCAEKGHFEMQVLDIVYSLLVTVHLLLLSIDYPWSYDPKKFKLTFVDYDRRDRTAPSRYPEDTLISTPVHHVVDRIIRNGYTLGGGKITWQDLGSINMIFTRPYLFELMESFELKYIMDSR